MRALITKILLNSLAHRFARRRIARLALLLLLTAAPATQLYAAPSFVYPLVGTKVSSNFGKRKHPVLRYVKHHSGIDLTAPDGAIVRTIAAGRVVFADRYAAYGNLVVVEHTGGYTSHYGHLEQIKVRIGEKVNAGQVIATVGHTGRVTGSHLHLEIRKGGTPLDPQKIIPGIDEEAEG